jgi:flagellar biosynthesis/type III secretory pathway chaperone
MSQAALSSARRRRAVETQSSVMPSQESENSVRQTNLVTTPAQAFANINQRLILLEQFAKQEQERSGTAATANSETDFENSPYAEEINDRFYILAEEINELKTSVLRLQGKLLDISTLDASKYSAALPSSAAAASGISLFDATAATDASTST